MDKIWYRKNLRSRRSLAVVAGMEQTNDHADRHKSNAKTKDQIIIKYNDYKIIKR